MMMTALPSPADVSPQLAVLLMSSLTIASSSNQVGYQCFYIYLANLRESLIGLSFLIMFNIPLHLLGC